MSRLLVHVGPTLPAAEVRQIAPSAEIQPPVEGGMLGRAQPRAGDVVVLIDGYYRDRPAVRHKEIMHLIHSGVTVLGAASMGALRAAELVDHGMLGVGRIYQMYKTGEIWGDDEVAVKHRPAEGGYRTDSVALVNLRFGSQLAVDEGVISPATGAAVVSVARELVFDERTWPRITATAQSRLAAAGRAELPALERYCSARERDLKAQDAVLAIEYGRRLQAGERSPAGGRPAGREPTDSGKTPPWRTSYLRDWVTYWRSMDVSESGDWISDTDVLDAARLYSADYPDVHHEVLSHLLAEATAAGPRDQTSAPEYVLGLVGLGVGDPLPDRFGVLLSAEERQLPTAEQATLVAVRAWPINICRDWRPFAIAKLKKHPSWARWRDLVLAADTARNGSSGQVRDIVAGLMFLHKWGVSGPAVTRELGRRGFLTLTGLDRVASRFAALELANRPGVTR